MSTPFVVILNPAKNLVLLYCHSSPVSVYGFTLNGFTVNGGKLQLESRDNEIDWIPDLACPALDAGSGMTRYDGRETLTPTSRGQGDNTML